MLTGLCVYSSDGHFVGRVTAANVLRNHFLHIFGYTLVATNELLSLCRVLVSQNHSPSTNEKGPPVSPCAPQAFGNNYHAYFSGKNLRMLLHMLAVGASWKEMGLWVELWNCSWPAYYGFGSRLVSLFTVVVAGVRPILS